MGKEEQKRRMKDLTGIIENVKKEKTREREKEGESLYLVPRVHKNINPCSIITAYFTTFKKKQENIQCIMANGKIKIKKWIKA